MSMMRNSEAPYPDIQVGYEEFTYNDTNDRTSHRDKNGNITSYEYDDKGNVIVEKTPTGDVIKATYSESGMATLGRGKWQSRGAE